ncbi:class I SAM-dependent methyltransferase [Streptomyces sp. NPDC102437]|uniref:class I SAM-dependent methyltransferase n=1 Tax=Streptomyces sp. NPDC102437 TaxID=3366175 RepID=UPI00380D6CEF
MHTLAAPDRWEAHYAAGRDFRPVLCEEETTFDQNVGRGIGLTALDIGCGTGGFARFLRERGYSVLGVDYAEAAVSRATSRSQNTTDISFQCWNAEGGQWTGIPTYDLISCRLSYAFIQNKTQFLNNVKTHLPTGGVFYVMTPLSDNLPPERRRTGISAEEIEELCDGWTAVKETELDIHHACYALTR